MYKKFFEGLLFGAGFTISMITIIWLYSFFSIQQLAQSINEHNELTFDTEQQTQKPELKSTEAPPLLENNRYLGSSAVYSSRFKRDTGAILPKGSGSIVGKVLGDNKPIQGVVLRLALNGSHMSQWAVSGTDGMYEISVPVGEYRIDGFDLNTVKSEGLAGFILHPYMGAGSGESFVVGKDEPSDGLTFRFVTPVKRLGKRQVFSDDEDISLSWESYPEADMYEVQVLEKNTPDSYKTKALFDWRLQPKVDKPFINLSDYDIEVKPGHFYILEITAIRANPYEVLSKTDRKVQGYDFKVVGD